MKPLFSALVALLILAVAGPGGGHSWITAGHGGHAHMARDGGERPADRPQSSHHCVASFPCVPAVALAAASEPAGAASGNALEPPRAAPAPRGRVPDRDPPVPRA